MTAPQFFFEDLVLHGVLETPGITLTHAHVALFRGIGADTPDDPDVIPDLLPLCLLTGLGWRIPQPPLAVLAFMGIDWKINRAARVGDTIMGRSRTIVKRQMRDAGVMIDEREIVDQRGETIQQGRFTFLVARRPADEPIGPA